VSVDRNKVPSAIAAMASMLVGPPYVRDLLVGSTSCDFAMLSGQNRVDRAGSNSKLYILGTRRR
jgi:hypothetical protein